MAIALETRETDRRRAKEIFHGRSVSLPEYSKNEARKKKKKKKKKENRQWLGRSGTFQTLRARRRGEARWTIRRVTLFTKCTEVTWEIRGLQQTESRGREKGESTRAVRCSLCASRLLSSKPRRRRPDQKREEGGIHPWMLPISTERTRVRR